MLLELVVDIKINAVLFAGDNVIPWVNKDKYY